MFAGFNQLWASQCAQGREERVEVVAGTRDDLALFHPVYVETGGRRDGSRRADCPTSNGCGTP